MNRGYAKYIADACNNGMSKEEMRYLFEDMYKKSNTRNGKRVLRFFTRGIVKAKKKVLEQNMAKQVEQQQITQELPQMEMPQMQKTFGTYKQ